MRASNEALDRKRNQRVAIKGAKTGFHRLLPSELNGALEVRHWNVCLVNEIHTAEATDGETDFLTMELLEGETRQRDWRPPDGFPKLRPLIWLVSYAQG